MATESENPKNDHESLIEEAQVAAGSAHSLRPDTGDWGIESCSDAPGGMGGGVGGFLWFKSRKELLDFVGRLLTFFSPGRGDDTAVAQEVSQIADRVASEELSMDEGLLSLNAALKSYSQVRWWGQFEDLLSGSGAFERELRAHHRAIVGADSNEADTSPIQPDEVDAFIDATVQSYGE